MHPAGYGFGDAVEKGFLIRCDRIGMGTAYLGMQLRYDKGRKIEDLIELINGPALKGVMRRTLTLYSRTISLGRT